VVDWPLKASPSKRFCPKLQRNLPRSGQRTQANNRQMLLRRRGPGPLPEVPRTIDSPFDLSCMHSLRLRREAAWGSAVRTPISRATAQHCRRDHHAAVGVLFTFSPTTTSKTTLATGQRLWNTQQPLERGYSRLHGSVLKTHWPHSPSRYGQSSRSGSPVMLPPFTRADTGGLSAPLPTERAAPERETSPGIAGLISNVLSVLPELRWRRCGIKQRSLSGDRHRGPSHRGTGSPEGEPSQSRLGSTFTRVPSPQPPPETRPTTARTPAAAARPCRC
jgi:hypothetical protein